MSMLPPTGEMTHLVKLQAATTGYESGGYTTVDEVYARVDYFAPRALVDGDQVVQGKSQVRIAIHWRADAADWRHVWREDADGLGRRFYVHGHRDPDGAREVLFLDCEEVAAGVAETAGRS